MSDPLPLSPETRAGWHLYRGIAIRGLERKAARDIIAIEQEARTLARAEVIAELRLWAKEHFVTMRSHHPNDSDAEVVYLDDVLAALSRLGERE